MTKNLKPLAAEDWDESIHHVREQLVSPPNIHATLANHPDLLKAWMEYRNHMVHGNTLDRRVLEILILRAAHRMQAEYEWYHHAIIALESGLTAEEIDQIAQDPASGSWDARDLLLLRAADECATQYQLTAETRDGLLQHFDARQMLDLLCTLGMYTTLAFILKTFEIPLDEDTPSFSVEKLS